MASLTEHVMINKLGDDLDNAITFVGGDTSSISNIMEYVLLCNPRISAEGVGVKLAVKIFVDGALHPHVDREGVEISKAK